MADPELADITETTTAVIHTPAHTVDMTLEGTTRSELVEELVP